MTTSNTTDTGSQAEALATLAKSGELIAAEVGKIIVGQVDVIGQILTAFFARGHVVIEGVPGLAKTLMINSLAETMSLDFTRVQFTPDLMPTDITGTTLLNEDEHGKRHFTFSKGPVFTNILLADEINRTPPKTQAALLEAMQEHSVSVGGKTFQLEEPFFVLATQNPIEQEGTYPLPEAQRDRFLFHVKVQYPTREQEKHIVEQTTGTFDAHLSPVLSGADIIRCQQTVRKVPVPDHVLDFVLDVVRKSRPDEVEALPFVKEMVEWGPGPRAAQYLVLAGKVRAVLRGRYHVTVDDIDALAYPVLRHRIVPTFNAEAQGITVEQIIGQILKSIPRGSEAKVM